MAAQLEGGVEVADGAVEVLRQAGAAAEQVEQGDLGGAADAAARAASGRSSSSASVQWQRSISSLALTSTVSM